MRTTVDLPEDLVRIARSIAADTRKTLSETIAMLMRRGLGTGNTVQIEHSQRTGLPVVRLAALVVTSTGDLLTVVKAVSPLLASAAEPSKDGGGELAASLATVATLIEADLPTRVYSVDLRGFDTHAGQAPVHADLLGELDSALGAFVDRMGDRP